MHEQRLSRSTSYDETTPLLHSGDEQQNDGKTSLRRSPNFILVIVMITVILLTAGDRLADAPETRIFESIICYKYWEKNDPTKLSLPRSALGAGAIGGVDEQLCKITDVQSSIAHLVGYLKFFDGIPALLFAIPFGIAADRIGRRPIFLLGCFSFVLRLAWIQFVVWQWQSINLVNIWWSSLHGILGGSQTVVTAMAFVIVTDITTDTTRATVFLWASACSMLVFFLVPPLSALLMDINPWVPYLGALTNNIVLVFIALLLPETLGHTHDNLEVPSPPRPHPSNNQETTLPIPPPTPTRPSPKSSFLQSLRANTTFLTHDLRVALLIMPIGLFMLKATASQLLLQYASTRYRLTFSTSTLLISIHNGVKVLILLLLLPFISSLLMKRYALTVPQKDLYLARASLVAISLGWNGIGFASNVPAFVAASVVTAFGWGGTMLIRSFMTGLVRKDDVAKLYTVISLIDTIALMLGGPFMAGLFERGLRMGEGMQGLPFWVLGGLYAACTVVTLVVGAETKEDGV